MLDFKTLFCEGKIFSHLKSSRNGFEKRFTFWNEYKSKKKSNVGNADLYEWKVYKVQCHNRALLDTYKIANNY